jgi:hypothetical protein
MKMNKTTTAILGALASVGLALTGATMASAAPDGIELSHVPGPLDNQIVLTVTNSSAESEDVYLTASGRPTRGFFLSGGTLVSLAPGETVVHTFNADAVTAYATEVDADGLAGRTLDRLRAED